MKIRIKNSSITLKVISLLQFIGGIVGLCMVAYLMLRTENITGPYLFVFFIGVALFCYSVYSGKRLFFDIDKTHAVIYSIVNYFLQIFHWSILGYGLTYSSGAGLTIGINGSTINFNFGAITSSFQISFNSDSEFFFKVNLFAILILIILFDILKEMKAPPPIATNQISEISEESDTSVQ